MDGVPQWLDRLGLGQFAAVFAEQQIDLEVLTELTDEDLEKLGIPLGPRKKLLKAITELRDGESRPPELLIPIYEWFTEGFATADLREAKALIESTS